jgi:hypothetical protein
VVAGLVETVVAPLGDALLEVEFGDDEGRTSAMAQIRADPLLVLRYARQRRGSLTSDGSRM